MTPGPRITDYSAYRTTPLSTPTDELPLFTSYGGKRYKKTYLGFCAINIRHLSFSWTQSFLGVDHLTIDGGGERWGGGGGGGGWGVVFRHAV